MRRLILLAVCLLASAFLLLSQETSEDRSSEKIIAMERGALDRWGKGDPQAYLEIMAPEATYFDPSQERRTDGLSDQSLAGPDHRQGQDRSVRDDQSPGTAQRRRRR